MWSGVEGYVFGWLAGGKLTKVVLGEVQNRLSEDHLVREIAAALHVNVLVWLDIIPGIEVDFHPQAKCYASFNTVPTSAVPEGVIVEDGTQGRLHIDSLCHDPVQLGEWNTAKVEWLHLLSPSSDGSRAIDGRLRGMP